MLRPFKSPTDLPHSQSFIKLTRGKKSRKLPSPVEMTALIKHPREIVFPPPWWSTEYLCVFSAFHVRFPGSLLGHFKGILA